MACRPSFLQGASSPTLRLASTCCLLLLLLTLAPGTSPAGLFYQVEQTIKLTDLDPGNGQAFPMVVTGLNDSGRVAGFFTTTAKVSGVMQNTPHAFAWDHASGLIDFGVSLSTSSMALCVNASGAVAGV